MKKTMNTYLVGVALLLSYSVYGQISTDSLILHLPFTGNTNDASYQGNNGIAKGATLATDRFGVSDAAYYFDGYDDYIEIPSIGDSVFQDNFTISIICSFSDFDKDYPSLIAGENNYIAFQGTGPTYQANAQKVVFYQGPNDQPEKRRVPAFFSTEVLSPNTYNHFIIVNYKDSVSLFINGILDNSVMSENHLELPTGKGLYLGTGFKRESYQCFRGFIDDVAIYNRAFQKNEVTELYNALKCPSEVLSDTSTFYVSNIEFAQLSPQYHLLTTDTINSNFSDCGQVINRMAKYIYDPNHCTETLYDTVTIADTLIVNIHYTGVDSPTNNGSILIFPNPTHDYVIIRTSNLDLLQDYKLKIWNSVGLGVYDDAISKTETRIDTNNFGKTGIYIIEIYDNLGSVILRKKLIID